MTKFIIVTTSCSHLGETEKIAKYIIEKSLGACAQITKIKSIYKWQDEIQESEEYRLEIKTISSKFQSIKNYIKEVHEYEIPEIIVTEIIDGSEGFFSWVKDSVNSLS